MKQVYNTAILWTKCKVTPPPNPKTSVKSNFMDFCFLMYSTLIMCPCGNNLSTFSSLLGWSVPFQARLHWCQMHRLRRCETRRWRRPEGGCGHHRTCVCGHRCFSCLLPALSVRWTVCCLCPKNFLINPAGKKKQVYAVFFFQQGNEVGSALLLESIHVSV